MATAQPDDELLYRGGELLSAGNPSAARPYLEEALTREPQNEKARNLLGLTYFKLGVLDRAADLYEQLVRDNPTDPTLRVNLGLVYLKMTLIGDAIREFETATDLSPEHVKAHNYLGLALAQIGDYQRARYHFLMARSDAMVEKMEQALQEQRQLETAPPPYEPPPVYEAPRDLPAPEAPASEQDRTAFRSLEGLNGETAIPVDDLVTAEDDFQGRAQALPPEPEPEPDFGQSEANAQASQEADDGLRFAEDEGPSAPPMPEETQPAAPLPMPQDTPLLSAEERTMVFGKRADLLREAYGLDGPPESVTNAIRTPAVAPALVPPEPITSPGNPAAESAEAATPALAPAPASAPNEELFTFPTQAGAANRSGPSLLAHLREVAPSLYVEAPRLGGGFVVGAELAMLPVQGELCARMGELVASVGALEVKPAFRRVRGRVTQEALGGDASPFSRVIGVGRVWLWAKGRGCVATKIADESLYVREERLVAFEDTISYENGRIPNTNGSDLPLIHLTGRGRILLGVDGLLRSVEVVGDVPLSVALEHWVGWYGKLTPRVLAPSNGHGRTVELTGEGVVLLRLPQVE